MRDLIKWKTHIREVQRIRKRNLEKIFEFLEKQKECLLEQKK